MLTYQDKLKNRSAIAGLRALHNALEATLERGEKMPKAQAAILARLAQTDEMAGQHAAIEQLLEDTDAAYMELLRADAPKSIAAFAEYIRPDEPPAPHHEWMCEKLEAVARRDIIRWMLSLPPGHAKAQKLDEPIATPFGWSTIGDLKIGDQVFDEEGKICNVIRKTGVFKDRPVFNVLTDCGDSISADEDHNWSVRLCGKREVYKIKTTRYLYDRQQGDGARSKGQGTGGKRASKRPMIKRAGALQLPDADLPIDPYVLGYWLGDGTSACPEFTIGDDDEGYTTGEFLRRGYILNALSAKMRYSLVGVRHHFSALGLLGNKHIPESYLRSSVQQRKALLQGIIDSDGHVHPDGQTMVSSKWKHLAEQYQELVRTLGAKCTIIERTAICTNGKDGPVDCGPCWSISFYMKDCALLPRKRALTKDSKRTPDTYIDIEPAGTADTMCIEVDSPSHLFLAGRSMTPTHNSTFCSHLFPVWYLGNHPNHRYLQAGHTQDFVEKEFGLRTRTIIESVEFQRVFPGLSLSTASKAAGAWSLAGKLGRYVAKGVGQGISGYRGNIAGVDDPYASRKDAESAATRKEVYDWFMADFTTRLLPRSPLFIVATRWHPLDLCGILEDNNKKGIGIPWEVTNLPALAEENDPLGRAVNEPLWPTFYDIDTLLNLKATLPSRDWNSLYRGRPIDENGGVLQASWIKRYTDLPINEATAQKIGNNSNIRRITISVDTANKDGERNDYTAITVWIEDSAGIHYLAQVIRIRQQFDAMVAAINSAAEKWGANAILIEDKGSGTQYIQTQANKAPAPIIPINVANDSKQFRFDAITPMFMAGEVLLPERAGWLADYEFELLSFPGGAHDDQVDSTSQYLSWARKGRRLGVKKAIVGGGIGASEGSSEADRSATNQAWQHVNQTDTVRHHMRRTASFQRAVDLTTTSTPSAKIAG